MEKQDFTRRIVLLVAGLLALAAPSAGAQQAIKRCATLEVRSLKVCLQFVQNIPLDAQQETIETHDAGTKSREITVVANGPILGSMDSEELITNLTCSHDGLALTATITRSADYHGAVRQNQLWFPQITIVVAPLTSEMVFKTIWMMRLSNGKLMERSRTPPYPEKRYPITVTKKIIEKK